MPEVRETAIGGRTLACGAATEVSAPFRGQAAGLLSWALSRCRAASRVGRTVRAAAQTVRKHQRTLPTKVFVFCAERGVGRKVWFEQGVIDGFPVALQLQSEAGGRGGKGQPGDARLLVQNLGAKLQRHVAAFFRAPFWAGTSGKNNVNS